MPYRTQSERPAASTSSRADAGFPPPFRIASFECAYLMGMLFCIALVIWGITRPSNGFLIPSLIAGAFCRRWWVKRKLRLLNGWAEWE